MPEKYTPNLDEIKRCWGLKVDTHKRPEREDEFDRAIAKVKADAVREAAEALNIRRNTARAHLRSIFSKTWVRRQTELVRIFLNSVAWLGNK